MLDIGCGSLRAGKLLIPYLLPQRYHGVEPQEWLVRQGIEKEIGKDLVALKSPRFAHNFEFDLSSFGRKFDFLVAQSILSHTDVDMTMKCLRSAREVMHERSVFAATYVEGDTNYDGDEAWVYPGCVTYQWDYFKGMVADAGLKAIKMQWDHPGWQTWVASVDPSNDSTSVMLDPANASRLLQHPYVSFGMKVRSWLKGLLSQSYAVVAPPAATVRRVPELRTLAAGAA